MSQRPAEPVFPPSPALRFESGWRTTITNPYCAFHDHLHFEIVHHPIGTGTTTLRDGTVIHFTDGSVVIYPPHQRHDQRVVMPATDICVLFSAVGLTPGPLRGWRHIPNVKDRYVIGELTALAHPLASLSRGEKTLYDYRVTTLVLHLLRLPAFTAGEPSPLPAESYARQALRHIREHYREIKRLEIVAEAIGISYDHLRHEFGRELGMSPKRCLLDMRLGQAKNLLRHSALPLKTIADLCGFDNERYFCTCFKAQQGETPGSFRRGPGRQPEARTARRTLIGRP